MCRAGVKSSERGVVSVAGPRLKTDLAVKGLVVMLPCLPAKSPTWHVAGWLGSQGGISPRMYGSKCAKVAVQLPFAGTGWSWMWYTARHVSQPNHFFHEIHLDIIEAALSKRLLYR